MNTIETQIESIVDSILSDYTHGRDIDKVDLKRHPEKEVVIDVITKLLRIVFAGYFRDNTYRMYNAKHNISMLMEDVMYNLNKQIRLILQSGMDDAEAKEKAQEICLEFFRRIPAVRATVQTDVEAAFSGDPAATSTDEIIFGDNDTLSAVVAALVDADLLILLSDIDGLYSDDPRINPLAKLIDRVDVIDEHIEAIAKDSSTKLGTGGMITKIRAARYATERGIHVVLANVSRNETIEEILGGKVLGTLFLGGKKK